MSVEVLNEGSRFDPTPEQAKAKTAADWEAMRAAYEVEQTVVAQDVEHLTAQLRSLDLCSPATRHDETVIAIDRVRVADQLDHKKARLVDIADAIAAHRKARP